MMPKMTKMMNLAIGTNETKEVESGYTDFDPFRVPIHEPEWVVVEADHLDLYIGCSVCARKWVHDR